MSNWVPRADYVPTTATEAAPRGLWDFLSHEAGRERSKRMGNILEHYIPPEARPLANVLAMFNPVNEMGEATASSRAAFTDPENRGKHVVNALTNTVGAAAPMAAAKFGVPVANALADTLLGFAPAANNAVDTARRFAADEYGGVNVDSIRARHPGAKVNVSGNAGRGYTIDRIVVPPEARGQGEGTRIMSDILRGVDEDGAVASLTPSGDFGGSKKRLQEFYKRFGFIDNKGRNKDFEISEAMYRPAQPKPLEVQRGDEILGLLKSGKGDEVTDEMLDMGDPTLNARLNMYLYDNYDLPMDEASRMARAEDGGFDTDAYHATRAKTDFQSFRPGVRGSIYLANSSDGAVRGAAGQALENPYAPPGAQSVTATMPVKISGGDVEGLSVNNAEWAALPDIVDDDATLRLMQDDIEKTGAKYWDDVYLSVPKGDAFRYYKEDPPVLTYADLEPGRDVFGYRLPGYNSGSDIPSLDRVAADGRKGFLVSDEAGSSVVAGPDMPIRSRFARFDPRLKHLRNLSASAAGASLLPYLMAEDEQ